MWVLTLLEQLTGFLPRPLIIRLDEAGFRQVPKPWKGWPWSHWPWIRWHWLCKPWRGKPWSSKDNNSSTWVIKVEPGEWYWIVPWIMEYEVCKTKLQIKDIRAQSVWTKDGVDVTVGTSTRYYVRDSMKAQLEVLDYDQSLQNAILGIVCNYVRKHTLEELKLGVDVLQEELTKSVREASDGWGLKIQDISITDIGRAKNLRVLLSGLDSFISVGG